MDAIIVSLVPLILLIVAYRVLVRGTASTSTKDIIQMTARITIRILIFVVSIMIRLFWSVAIMIQDKLWYDEQRH